MNIKTLPSWLQGLVGGFSIGAIFWAISGISFVGFIPKMLGLGLAYLWKIISMHTIWPLFGYSTFKAFDIYGMHREMRPFFLTLTLTVLGALIMSKKKILRIIGLSVSILIVLATLVRLSLAFLIRT